MTAFFGISMTQIMVWSLTLCLVLGGIVVALALRHRMLLSLALRNVPRRRSQTILIITGLMLSTAIISSSFATGDTMAYSARSLVADTLGRVDEVVVSYSPRGGVGKFTQGLAGLTTGYFPQADYTRLASALQAIPHVAGVTPAIVVNAALIDATSRQSKAQVTLIALPPDYSTAFGRLVGLNNQVMTLGQLGPDQVYLNRQGADALAAAPGDELRFYFGYGNTEVVRHLKAVVHNGGPGGSQPVAILPLGQLQQISGRIGQINQIDIANQGNTLSSNVWSPAVMQSLKPILIDRQTAGQIRAIVRTAAVQQAISQAWPSLSPNERAKMSLMLAASAFTAPDGGATTSFMAALGDREVLYHLGAIAFRMADRASGQQLFHLLEGAITLSANDVKSRGLAAAATVGAATTSVFLGLGLFSIASGMLLIFLIFVMLAAERRTEMGVARAIGMQRSHLIELFVFEGAFYDVVATCVGMAVGLGVGFGTVRALSALLSAFDVRIQFFVEPRSVVVSACLGLLLTLGTVGLSAWRVSRLNIVAAIRNLPDDASPASRPRLRPRHGTGGRTDAPWRRGVRRLAAVVTLPWRQPTLRAPLLAVLGGVLVLVSRHNSALLPIGALGRSLAIVGVALTLPLLFRRLGMARPLADRICYTLAGLALLLYWGSPFNMIEVTRPSDLQAGVELYFLAGTAMVAGAVWAVIYNADGVIVPLVAVAGRLLPMAAVLRTATAYALRQRFRTGMALAMFALVVFTMVVASVLSTASARAYGNVQIKEGGFDIRGDVQQDHPIADIHTALMHAIGVKPSEFTAVGSLATTPGAAIETTAATAFWQTEPLNAAGTGFLSGTHLSFSVRATGYRDDAAIWRALRDHPGFAVVDAGALAADPAAAASRTSFTLSDVFRGQHSMAPVTVWVRADRGGRPAKLTVIGVLDPRAAFGQGLTASRATFAVAMPFPEPLTFYFRMRRGLNVHEVARGLGLSFVSDGMQTQVLADELQQTQGVPLLLNQLIESYMGLGLVVGVAALGVISTRAVVDRRQQIGVMRALGFQRLAIQLSFLLESSFVALAGAAVGIVLGLRLARNLTDYIGIFHPEIVFSVPWVQLLVIAAVACGASLAATWVPARRASHVLPAEALRYS